MRNELYNLCLCFRKALQETAADTGLPNLRSFPKLACGDSAVLLAIWLEKNNFSPISYVFGQKDGQTHAWLEVGDIIADITADQFGQQPVICSQSSDWHAGFKIDDKHPASLSGYGKVSQEVFRKAYGIISAALITN